MAVIRPRKHPSGKITWEVLIRRSGRKPISRSWKKEEDAIRFARREEARIDRAAALGIEDVSDAPFSAVLDRYEQYRLPRLAKTTRNRMQFHLDEWRRRLGDLRISRISKGVIAAERDDLSAGRSPATLNRYLAALSSVLSMAAGEWGLLESNPCRALHRLPEKPRERYLQPDELVRLVKECRESKNPLLYPMFILSLSTGIRQGEMAALRWEDISFKQGRLHVRDSKNSKPRTIPLTQTAIAALKSTQAENVVVLSGPVFGAAKFPREAWEGARSRAGLRDFRWHDIRHTCASYLVQQGVSIRMVAEILGHRTLQMSMRYSHLAPDHLADGLAAAEKAMFGEK